MIQFFRMMFITIIGFLSLILIVFFLKQICYDAQRARQPLVQNMTKKIGSAKSINHWKGNTEEVVDFTVQYGKNSNQRMVRKGILIKKKNARAIILICHGFMCDKDDVRFLRTLFQSYSTFTFDFRAHGECSYGQYCTLGSREMYDVIGAVDFIKSDKDLSKLPLIVYGFSMGAVSSILAQAYAGNLFEAAIWDCPFDSTDKIIERSIERLKINIGNYEFSLPGKSLLKKYAYNTYIQEILKAALKTVAKLDASSINTCIEPVDTVAAAQKITIPSLFITCKNDSKAPIEAVSAVYENTNGYKRFWITNGRHHFDSYFYNPEKYSYCVKEFIENFLNGKLNNKKRSGVLDDAIPLSEDEEW